MEKDKSQWQIWRSECVQDNDTVRRTGVTQKEKNDRQGLSDTERLEKDIIRNETKTGMKRGLGHFKERITEYQLEECRYTKHQRS